MKVLIFGLLLLAGCSSVPKKLMKNCKEAGKGSGLYYCEEIPKKDVNSHR